MTSHPRTGYGCGERDESARFPSGTAEVPAQEVSNAGWSGVVVEATAVATPVADFAVFWRPFTLGVGPAPGWMTSLPVDSQQAPRRRLEVRFGDSGIDHIAGAWAVRERPDPS